MSTSDLAALLSASEHATMLTLRAARALAAGDAREAFRYADRRCRIARSPSARDYLLRAEALGRLGDPDAAAADVAAAAALDPSDPPVALRLLQSPDAAARRRAAWALLRSLTSRTADRRLAVEALFQGGDAVVTQLRRAGTRISGWACWPGSLDVRILCRGAGYDAEQVLRRDPRHPLSGTHSACLIAFDIDFLGECRVEFDVGGRRVPCPLDREVGLEPAARRRAAEDEAPAFRELMSVVPVYEDDAATRACLETLLRQEMAGLRHRIVVIDDASPNPGIRAFVRELAADGRVELLANAVNRGFAASVNRALRLRRHGEDAVLVNADTLLPVRALVRLGEAAYGSPQVGTVTPWSNNGDLFSLPERNVVNPLSGLADVEAWDAAAAAANGSSVVDAPNGVGFCMFITSACLDRVGGLAEGYGRGYYEDVDLCLRAKALGFRNVCATGVYVGHHGSRSFNQAKRDLVVHNQTVLTARFPDYRVECAAYVELDPLRQARDAVCRRLPPRPVDILHLAFGAAPQGLVEDRIGELRDAGRRVVLGRARGDRMILTGAAGETPHGLSFGLDDADVAALSAYLTRLAPDRIELSGAQAVPQVLRDAILAFDRPIDWLMADGSLLAPAFETWRHDCRADPDAVVPCARCLDAYQSAIDAGPLGTSAAWLSELTGRVERIVALTPVAGGFVRRFLGPAATDKLVDAAAPAVDGAASGEALGVFVGAGDARTTALLTALSATLRAAGVAVPLVVFGRTMADLSLMGQGNVFAAGAYGRHELAQAIARFDVRAIVLPERDAGSSWAAARADLMAPPAAYFDYSFGEAPASSADLALDPRLCDASAAREIVQWFAGL